MALKIVKSARHYTETALDEIDLLKKVHISVVCKPTVKQGVMEGGGFHGFLCQGGPVFLPLPCSCMPRPNPLTRKRIWSILGLC